MTRQRLALAQVCEFIVDCEHRTAPVQAEGYPSIRTPNIGRGRLILDNVKRVSESVYQEWTRRATPEPGDLILAREAPVGNVAIVPPGLQVCLGQRTVLIRPDRSRIDPNYLLYLLLSDQVQGQIASLTNGATVHHLNMSDIRGFLLPPLPALEQQQQIGELLANFDDLIENNRRRIGVLEELARGLYREWFVRFRFPGHEGVRLVESAVGVVPEGWEVAPIGDVIETLGGGTPSTKEPDYWEGGGITWFSPPDLTAAGSMFISESSKQITPLGLRSSSARMFPAYSVMMTSRATIGVTAFNTVPACTNQGFITCIPNERLSAIRIYYWIEQKKQEIISLASGATFKEISRGTFRKLPVLIPDPVVSQRFDHTVDAIVRTTENVLRQNECLRRTRELLLPRLLTGRDVLSLGPSISTSM